MQTQQVKRLFDLEGKIAVITGGCGQIGTVVADAFVQLGARVAIFDIPAEPPLESAIEKSETSQYYQVDITKKKSVEVATTALCRHMGVPHILINLAAIDSPPDASSSEVGPFETYPETSFDRVMEVNVKGMFLCCQAIGRRMAEEKRGSIINISSTYGILSPCQDIYDFLRVDGNTFYKPVAYSTSKSAVLNFTRYLATYWAKKGVRVNTLTPAGIYNKQPEKFLDAYCQRIPIGRMAAVEEMIGPVVFLASEASSYMTGSNLVVDGGWSAW